MMGSALDQPLRDLAPAGVRVHLWPCAAGYQANVAEPGSNAWTCHTAADPIDALAAALRMRAARVPDRVGEAEVWVEEQTDLEEFLLRMGVAPKGGALPEPTIGDPSAPVDPFEDMLA